MTKESKPFNNVDRFNNFFSYPIMALGASVAIEVAASFAGYDMSSIETMGIYTGLLSLLALCTKAQKQEASVLDEQEKSLIKRSQYMPVVYAVANTTVGWLTTGGFSMEHAGAGICLSSAALLAEFIVHEKNKKFNTSSPSAV